MHTKLQTTAAKTTESNETLDQPLSLTCSKDDCLDALNKSSDSIFHDPTMSYEPVPLDRSGDPIFKEAIDKQVLIRSAASELGGSVQSAEDSANLFTKISSEISRQEIEEQAAEIVRRAVQYDLASANEVCQAETIELRNSIPESSINQELTRKAQGVLDRLNPDGIHGDMKIVITNDSSFNAYTNGGGLIVMSQDAFQRLTAKDDGPLELVIAHEMAHDLADHCQKLKLMFMAQSDIFADLQKRIDKDGSTAEAQRDLAKTILAVALLRRDAEREADGLVEEIFKRAGIKPHGDAQTVLSEVSEAQNKKRFTDMLNRRGTTPSVLNTQGVSESERAGMLRTHPLTSEREALDRSNGSASPLSPLSPPD